MKWRVVRAAPLNGSVRRLCKDSPLLTSIKCANGYDRSAIAEAEAWLAKCRRADELIDLVRRAFADVKLEDGIGLRESDGIDDYAGSEELKRLRATDEKKRLAEDFC